MPKPKTLESKPLKTFFNEHFDAWKRRKRMGLAELAELCGVTPSYLGHVGRYGRVPGKPVLMLLALNFELRDPGEIFAAAGLKEPWPYESGIALARRAETESGLLSVKLDMSGFTDAVKEIVRAELKPRTVRDLTRGRPLRVGFNMAQPFFFGACAKDGTRGGFFPEFFHLLSLALQMDYEVQEISYLECFDRMAKGELDIYGPIHSTPPRIGKALYTHAFARIPVTTLWRKRKASNLAPLAIPKSLSDLRAHNYQIAVLNDTSSHHLALTLLDNSDASLLVCSSPEEALERVTALSIPRPAHLMLCDTLVARAIVKEYPKDFDELALGKERGLGTFDNVAAVRPDWPELLHLLNDGTAFILEGKSFADLFERHAVGEWKGAVELPRSAVRAIPH